jgi:hypothetical protein
VVAGIMADYEEQSLITNIKSGRHCSVCLVPPDKREHLQMAWPKRTHESTQQQILLQRDQNTERTHDDWVHDVVNFAWGLPHLNIHEAMMLDILHQLLKGMVMHLLQWIKSLLDTTNTITKERRRQGKSGISQSAINIQLDDRFNQVPYFPGLKRFHHFSHVKQWTGDEQKAILRQLIPVITPLLSKKFPDAMQCTRAIVDFITMASYRTHDESTLQYLDQALYRIDKTKEAFRSVRAGENGGDGHFNFPKFHAMSHYVEYIRRFGSADGTDTSHSEAGHKYHLKAFYSRTNKGEEYMNQIFAHTIRRQNELSMSNMIFSKHTASTSQGNDRIETYGTKASQVIDLSKYGCQSSSDGYILAASQGVNPRYWRTVQDLSTWAEVEGFTEALAVFVRQTRNRRFNVRITNDMLDRREQDSSWVLPLLVALHPSLHCWRPDGKDSSNTEALTKEIIRCRPKWHHGTEWRRDWVWVQEHENSNITNGSIHPLGGRLIGQLQLIISVQDPDMLDDQGIPLKYTAALVRLVRFRNNGKPHKVHGMIELEEWPGSQALHAKKLAHCCFYDMSTIIRSAHIVPAWSATTYFINNYIDWDQYNTCYDPDFLENGIRDADAIYKKYTSTGRKCKFY